MRKNIKSIILAILLVSLIISTVLLAYLHFFASNDNNLSGEWTASLDMTEQAAVAALGWLDDIEAVSVSMEDMEPYIQKLNINLQLTFEQTVHTKGTFHCSVLPESYDSCKQAAYEGFAAAFRKLLADRLRMSGYMGSTDDENIEALVIETFGMSTISYLMSYGPDLLPSLEDLQAQYDGSGTYQTEQDILTRQFDTGTTMAQYFIRKDSSLILSGEANPSFIGYFSDHYPMIYTQQTKIQ